MRDEAVKFYKLDICFTSWGLNMGGRFGLVLCWILNWKHLLG